jgi:alpha-L-fucosidase 2
MFWKTDKRSLLLLLFFSSLFYPSLGQERASLPDALSLWYLQPAADWNEALPVGNGRLGAMQFGGIAQERLQLNEESVWTGKPADFVNPQARAALPKVRELLFAGKYAQAQAMAQEQMMGDKMVPSSYQTLGNLLLDFDTLHRKVKDYRRELDLENAIARVRYRADDINFSRELFSSAPDQALVFRLTADKPGAISFQAHLNRPGDKALIEIVGNEIIMSEHVGNGVGVKMVARLKLLQEGGSLETVAGGLQVQNADAVTLLLSAATDYRNEDPMEVSGSHMEAAAAAARDYEELKRRHIADYQQYFKRLDLDLGTTEAVYFPTDTRLAAVQQGNEDPQLLALHYQYGRYLLISSSRPGGLPANLQGIWADGLTPPWSVDYHINIVTI